MTEATRRREAGFTLVEALITIVILVFGLIAVANLFVVATSSNRIGHLATVTAAEASEVMEKIKALPFAALVPGGDLNADAPNTNATPDVTAATYNCQRTLPGVGLVRTRWTIVNTAVMGGSAVFFVTVRSEVVGPFGGQMSRSEFATFRVPF